MKKVKYDEENDIVFVVLEEGKTEVAETLRLNNVTIIIGRNKKGKVREIEII